MTTIDATVQQALQVNGYGQYATYATPVVQALVEREEQIADQIIRFARENNLNPDAVRSSLVDVGMHVNGTPTPGTIASMTEANDQEATVTEIQSGASDQDPTLRMLTDIQGQIARLTEFARRHGYSG